MTRLTREPEWTELNTLSCATLGSSVLFSTDDWFAAAENLLSPEPAVWKEGFTEQGKVILILTCYWSIQVT